MFNETSAQTVQPGGADIGFQCGKSQFRLMPAGNFKQGVFTVTQRNEIFL